MIELHPAFTSDDIGDLAAIDAYLRSHGVNEGSFYIGPDDRTPTAEGCRAVFRASSSGRQGLTTDVQFHMPEGLATVRHLGVLAAYRFIAMLLTKGFSERVFSLRRAASMQEAMSAFSLDPALYVGTYSDGWEEGTYLAMDDAGPLEFYSEKGKSTLLARADQFSPLIVHLAAAEEGLRIGIASQIGAFRPRS